MIFNITYEFKLNLFIQKRVRARAHVDYSLILKQMQMHKQP